MFWGKVWRGQNWLAVIDLADCTSAGVIAAAANLAPLQVYHLDLLSLRIWSFIAKGEVADRSP